VVAGLQLVVSEMCLHRKSHHHFLRHQTSDFSTAQSEVHPDVLHHGSRFRDRVRAQGLQRLSGQNRHRRTGGAKHQVANRGPGDEERRGGGVFRGVARRHRLHDAGVRLQFHKSRVNCRAGTSRT
jgi:hypothetical protein